MPSFMHRAQDHSIVIERIAYHRNGICGNGFHVLLFRQLDNTPMVGVVFEEPGNIAVFNRDLVGQSNVDFYANSWRGDEYEQALRQGVADYRKAQELLPAEKWGAGWSPLIDPIPVETPPGPGNAGAANALLQAIPAAIKRRGGK